jgi:DNA-binding LacI/PurR family transcriptional regulator/signal transduction histidine kinase
MKRNGKPTLAFLSTQFTRSSINRSLWQGVCDACQARDANVVCLPINPLHLRHASSSLTNVLLDLVTPENFDGLVIWGSGLINQADPDAVRTIFEKAARYPAVNISHEYEGIPAVFIDNRTGMRAVCDHLLAHHGCRRPAFIRGPEGHAEAEVRFAACRESLAAHGLAFDPALVAVGDFSAVTGRQCAKRLLDAGRGEIDALICANDLMAFGALLEADARGLRVPEDIAVTGFDDLEECLSLIQHAPLTTVSQPFGEMGARATDLLLDRLAGREPAPVEFVPSRLVIRQSCGCGITAAAPRAAEGVPRDAVASLKRERLVSLARTEWRTTNGREDDAAPALAALGGALADGLERNDETAFTTACDAALSGLKTETSVTDLTALMAALEKTVATHAADGAWRWRAEKLLARARLAVVDHGHRLRNRDRLRDEYESDQFQDLIYRLIASFNMKEFFRTLEAEFPRLGIAECCFALYSTPKTSLEKSTLVLALRDGVALPPAEAMFEFFSKELIPDRLSSPAKSFAAIVETLSFERESLGFVVFGGDCKPLHLYTALQRVLSVTLKGALLMQEQESLFRALAARTRELQRLTDRLSGSNGELQEFAYIASHDLKDPVRKVMVFAERLRETAAAALDERGLDYLARMQKTAVRMEALITSLLDFSRVTTNSKPFTAVDLTALLAAVLEDLEVVLESKQAVVETGALPVIEADASQMQQLFHNLIANAVKFNTPGVAPLIRIASRPVTLPAGDACEIGIEDNGIGIEEKYAGTIFGVFQRLHSRNEYEGTGIGLAICKKVVERHQGTIRVESAPGRGARFVVTLPLTQG